MDEQAFHVEELVKDATRVKDAQRRNAERWSELQQQQQTLSDQNRDLQLKADRIRTARTAYFNVRWEVLHDTPHFRVRAQVSPEVSVIVLTTLDQNLAHLVCAGHNQRLERRDKADAEEREEWDPATGQAFKVSVRAPEQE